jgi:histidine phosphotransfer protein HptB
MTLPNLVIDTAVAFDNQLDKQQIALLRTLRNGALLPQLLRTYRDQASKQIDDLQNAISIADHKTAGLIAHTLKSASLSIGAKRIGELCAGIESNARQQQLGDSETLCLELAQRYGALLPEIEQHLTS